MTLNSDQNLASILLHGLDQAANNEERWNDQHLSRSDAGSQPGAAIPSDMKTDYTTLDALLLSAVAAGALSFDAILAISGVREAAIRVARRRAGASPSESTDKTINERLQVQRRAGKIDYDRATCRWTSMQEASGR